MKNRHRRSVWIALGTLFVLFLALIGFQYAARSPIYVSPLQVSNITLSETYRDESKLALSAVLEDWDSIYAFCRAWNQTWAVEVEPHEVMDDVWTVKKKTGRSDSCVQITFSMKNGTQITFVPSQVYVVEAESNRHYFTASEAIAELTRTFLCNNEKGRN